MNFHQSIKIALTLSVVVLCSFTLSSAAQTIKYNMYVSNGKKAGEQVIQYEKDGWISVKSIFKDNGRGPETQERLQLSADGLLKQYTVKGTSTFGSTIDEQFSIEGNLAKWKSTSEKGEAHIDKPTLYLPISGTSIIDTIALQALTAQGKKELPLLPSGTMSIETVGSLNVTHKDGKKQTVNLLAIKGVGLSPSFEWVTTDEKPRVFGTIVPGYLYAIEEGWESNTEAMEKFQTAAEGKYLRDFASKHQHALEGVTVIKNVRVFDSHQAQLSQAMDVYISRGKINLLLPTGSPIRGAHYELDGAGKILMPGMFDMHGHVGRWDGALNIAAGVTSVRDMGNDNTQMQMMINETARGDLLSPRIIPTGFLEGESPFSANNGFVIKDLQGAKNAIDWYAQNGYHQIKIYNSFPKEILKETVAYAHSRHMRVSGHIPVGLRAFEALDAGYDEIQHINQVMLNFLATPQTDTRTLDRFILPAEKTAAIDFNAKVVKDFVMRLKTKQISIDPTLATFSFLRQPDGVMNEPFVAIADHMPPNVKRGFSVGTMKIENEEKHQLYEKSYAKMIEFVGILYKNGVPIVAGTDEMAGFTLQSELVYLVKAGLTPAQALQVATKNAATYSRASDDRGVLEIGKLADMILIDGDPTQDINDIRKVSAVITRGYLIYPNEIYQSLGIKPFVNNPPALKKLEVHSTTNAYASNAPSQGGNEVIRQKLMVAKKD